MNIDYRKVAVGITIAVLATMLFIGFISPAFAVNLNVTGNAAADANADNGDVTIANGAHSPTPGKGHGTHVADGPELRVQPISHNF